MDLDSAKSRLNELHLLRNKIKLKLQILIAWEGLAKVNFDECWRNPEPTENMFRSMEKVFEDIQQDIAATLEKIAK